LRSYERPVRFEDVDAAGIMFFPRFLNVCHEAMEAFFDTLPGGYPDLIVRRRIGVPAVKVEAEYSAPVRYGDVLVIETGTTHVGLSSAALRYAFTRKGDGAAVAVVHHTVVCCDLTTVRPLPLPPDVRAALEAHRV